jgi:DNA polymerase epsilon subunit 2
MCRVLTGHVALDLSNATATPGIFTENAMVVVEGEVVNGLFRVVTIGFPPPEPRCT